MKFEDVTVTIDKARWDVTITIEQFGMKPVVYIASADSALTERDGIWFDTPEETKKFLDY